MGHVLAPAGRLASARLVHLVMFDIDGTLVNSHDFDSHLFSKAVREATGAAVDETWVSYRHVTDSGILEEVLTDCVPEPDRPEAREQVKGRFVGLVQAQIARMANTLEPIPGAPELLRRLRSRPGVVLALATGGWRETAEMKLRAAGIEFEGLPFATASEAEARVEIMRLAEQQAAAYGSISRRSYFGDAPWDLRASADLGYDFVAVGNRVEHSLRFPDLREQDAILGALGL